MEIIECIWEIKQNFNEVQVIGKAPVKNNSVRPQVEKVLVRSALKFIRIAKKTSECIVLTKEPNNVILNTEHEVAVSFTVMFRDPSKIDEFGRAIKS